MNAMANPTRRTQLLDEGSVLRHRSLFCPEYDDCLEAAAEAHWTSWSCERCPLAAARAARAEVDAPAAEPADETPLAVH